MCSAYLSIFFRQINSKFSNQLAINSFQNLVKVKVLSTKTTMPKTSSTMTNLWYQLLRQQLPSNSLQGDPTWTRVLSIATNPHLLTKPPTKLTKVSYRNRNMQTLDPTSITTNQVLLISAKLVTMVFQCHLTCQCNNRQAKDRLVWKRRLNVKRRKKGANSNEIWKNNVAKTYYFMTKDPQFLAITFLVPLWKIGMPNYNNTLLPPFDF